MTTGCCIGANREHLLSFTVDDVNIIGGEFNFIKIEYQNFDGYQNSEYRQEPCLKLFRESKFTLEGREVTAISFDEV